MPAVCTKYSLQTLSYNYNRQGEEQQMLCQLRAHAVSALGTQPVGQMKGSFRLAG